MTKMTRSTGLDVLVKAMRGWKGERCYRCDVPHSLDNLMKQFKRTYPLYFEQATQDTRFIAYCEELEYYKRINLLVDPD